jgi:hypothetical protein
MEKFIIVPDDERITSDYMSHFEFIDLISRRATELQNLSKSYLTNEYFQSIGDDISNQSHNSLAYHELLMKKSPLSVSRVRYNNEGQLVHEIWKANELKILHEFIFQ